MYVALNTHRGRLACSLLKEHELINRGFGGKAALRGATPVADSY
jgi:hypothetical protein